MKSKVIKLRWLLLGSGCLIAALVWAILTAREIASFGATSSSGSADAAIVLGAAVWKDSPSPVFKERINHAVDLYRQKRVRKIIFTGGRAEGDVLSEAAAAKRYSIALGIPESDLMVEESSRTTYENLANAKSVGIKNHLNTFLIVSDPLHMRRAMDMANDLKMNSAPSPTATSLYRSGALRRQFLWRETYYLLEYRLWDRFVLARSKKH